MLMEVFPLLSVAVNSLTVPVDVDGSVVIEKLTELNCDTNELFEDESGDVDKMSVEFEP